MRITLQVLPAAVSFLQNLFAKRYVIAIVDDAPAMA